MCEVFTVYSWPFTSLPQMGLLFMFNPQIYFFGGFQKERKEPSIPSSPGDHCEPHPSENADIFVLNTVLRDKLMGG